jgi:hypothetical protein
VPLDEEPCTINEFVNSDTDTIMERANGRFILEFEKKTCKVFCRCLGWRGNEEKSLILQ